MTRISYHITAARATLAALICFFSVASVSAFAPGAVAGSHRFGQKHDAAIQPSTTTTTTTRLHMSTSLIPKVAIKATAAVAGAALAGTAAVKLVLDRPSRTYGEDTVAREYDAWADDGILEYYWGEHIHLGK